jgi:PKD repeat protein|tara:strand:+ start:41507 stop:42541 length:1035 start_codon:yes stop_codon:yes gene_type:complete
MFKKSLSLFLLLFIINCGGGGGGGEDPGPGPSNDPPVASFSANPLSGSAPLTVSFTSTSTNATSHDWDFNGDGVLDASGVLVSYTYNNAGSYTVILTATGPDGVDSVTRSNYVTVTPSPPSALFTANPTSGKKDLRVEFSNSSLRYNSSSWDFGDGNTSTEDSPTHMYTTSGTYDVTLSVVGDGGSDTNTFSGYINVNDVQTPAIVLDPKYIETTSGSSVPIEVKILGVSGMAAAQVTLFYDSSVMTYDSVTAGDFLKGDSDPLLVVTSNPGINRLIFYTSSLSSDLPSNDGDGVIATINFTFNGSEDTTVNFGSDTSGNIMLDVDGANITVNDVEGASILINE